MEEIGTIMPFLINFCILFNLWRVLFVSHDLIVGVDHNSIIWY